MRSFFSHSIGSMQFILCFVIGLVSSIDIEAATELAPIGVVVTQQPSQIEIIIPEANAHTSIIQEAIPMADVVSLGRRDDASITELWYRALALMGSIAVITIAVIAWMFH